MEFSTIKMFNKVNSLWKECREKVLKRTCEANQAGENNSFIFIICLKSVPLHHFKLAYVVLHMAVKEFFETHF